MVALAETLMQPNHLRAFALVVTLNLGGLAAIPSISLYLVVNVGDAEASLPLVSITGGGLLIDVWNGWGSNSAANALTRSGSTVTVPDPKVWSTAKSSR
jgi:hypothetical protein